MKRSPVTQNQNGFSLMAVIMALAVVAIIAGAITPLVYRQMMAARAEATTAELIRIEAGLAGFYADVGRFPSEAEGLTALVRDPGLSGWRGPYVAVEQEDPATAVTTDAWNLAYVYDLQPATSPAGAATVLVASGGVNRLFDAGSMGGTWTVGGGSDDLLGLVRNDRLNRENTTGTMAEQERLVQAAQAYFRDQGIYPLGLNELTAGYLDAGINAGAVTDQWHRSYILAVDNNAVPPTMTITSLGPDGVSGGGDDVVLGADSAIPGRRTSHYELAIAQAAVDAAGGTNLTGDWAADAPAFNLLPALASDGWGQPYEERMSTRTILSGGPDADYFTPEDNIPVGVVPDDI